MTKHPGLRPGLAVIGSVLTFAMLIERAGLIPAVMLTVLIASSGSRDLRVRDALVLAVCVAATMSLLFVGFLDQPFTLVAGF